MAFVRSALYGKTPKQLWIFLWTSKKILQSKLILSSNFFCKFNFFILLICPGKSGLFQKCMTRSGLTWFINISFFSFVWSMAWPEVNRRRLLKILALYLVATLTLGASICLFGIVEGTNIFVELFSLILEGSQAPPRSFRANIPAG